MNINNASKSWKTKLFTYMASQGISLLGSSIVSFAMIWYVTLQTGSGVAIAGITITTYLPQALIMLLGGVLADRYSSKLIVALADTAVALSTLILALLFLCGHGSIGWIFFFNGLRSIGSGIQMPAIKSLLPQLVPEDELMGANSISTSVWCITQLIAPGLSGIVLECMSLTGSFFIDVITAIIGISLLMTIAFPSKAASNTNSGKLKPIEELKSATKYIINNKPLRNSTLFYGIFSFLVIPAAQLTPLLATQLFGNKIWLLSVTETAFSLGALLISIILYYKTPSMPHYKLIGFSAILFGLTMLLLLTAHHPIIFIVLMLLMGIGSPLYYTPLTTYIQEITDEAYIGRTFSFVELFSSLATPLGMLLFGPLANLSIIIPFLVPGILLIILGLKSKMID